jgi:hypothetical protein
MKCCGVNERWLNDRAVIGEKKSKEKARKGRGAKERRGIAGVEGKSSWKTDEYEQGQEEKRLTTTVLKT